MSDITHIEQSIAKKHIKTIAEQRFGDIAKAVVDIEQRVTAIGDERMKVTDTFHAN